MESLITDWDLTINADDYSLQYFKKKKISLTESAMIEVLENSKSKHEIYWAVIALRKLGTINCIEALKSVVFSSSKDVQGTSVLTIAKLANGSENKFLESLLLEKRFTQKWYTLVAIFFCENDLAISDVLEYASKVIRNSKDLPESGGLLLTYIARHAPTDDRAKKIFDKVNKDFDMLYPVAKKCLKNEFPTILGN